MNRQQNLLKICRDMGLLESKSLIQDIKCGIHSGFKDCCIIYWLTDYIKHYTCSSKERLEYKYGLECSFDKKYSDELTKYEKKHKKYIGYIPCKKCFKHKKFIKVKNCKCTK